VFIDSDTDGPLTRPFDDGAAACPADLQRVSSDGVKASVGRHDRHAGLLGRRESETGLMDRHVQLLSDQVQHH